jgi:hypothetical protein
MEDSIICAKINVSSLYVLLLDDIVFHGSI